MNALTPNKIVTDGYVDWSGGMDTARSPASIGKNQIVWSTNCQINKSKSGIGCRPGYRPLNLIFSTKREQEIFKTGDFQGDGYYFTGQEYVILISISGYVFQLRKSGMFTYHADVINLGSQNNPNNRNAYITAVNGAAVVNDSESSPLQVILNAATRVTGKYRIKPGRAGVYVQNRFFYIDEDGKSVRSSTIRNPFSLEEAYTANIYGFYAPEDEDNLVAVGRLATLNNSIAGGNLAFATNRNIYSVDVRGGMSSWGRLQSSVTDLGNIAQQYIGYVQGSLPDLGAVSPFSFESFNANLYFRNITQGIVSLNRAQSQFANSDKYISQSIEANRFLETDAEIFLPQCRTKGYKERIFTTINPFQKNNTVLWKGLLSYIPVPYSSSQEGIQPSFFETVYTGLNIHSILNVKYQNKEEDLFLTCVDNNGYNVIYVLDETIDYDINQEGKKVEIERKILTRAFDFTNPLFIKKGESQSYALDNLKRDTRVTIFTRKGDEGQLTQQYDITHKSGNYLNKGKFKVEPFKPQDRDNVACPSDPALKGQSNKFYLKQDLIILKGQATLKRWIRSAFIDKPDSFVSQEEKTGIANKFTEEKIYTYSL